MESNRSQAHGPRQHQPAQTAGLCARTKKHKVPTPSDQYLEAFEKAWVTADSASETLADAENQMIEIVKEAKASLPTGEFQNFWDRLNYPEYLLEEIESALSEVDGETDQDDDEAAD